MSHIEKAVFGGGCFWCTEAVFKMLKGVTAVMSGYAGGSAETAHYSAVSNGNTGHVEVVQIEFDPSIVSFETLLTIFFASHDPTTVNRQGNDIGTQYRSVIFYSTPEQKTQAEMFIKNLNASSEFGAPIVTSVEPLDVFYKAENYHQDYYENNKSRGYCQVIINPKLEKVQKKFADLLTDVYKNK